MLLGLLALPAHASLAWSWTTPRDYHLEASLQTFHAYRVYDVDSLDDARLTKMGLVTDMSCVGTLQGKNTSVVCTLANVDLTPTAFQDDQVKAEAIFSAYEQALKGARVEILVKEDGRFATVDLEGPAKRTPEEARSHEAMRQILRRGFATLELTLPKGEPDGPWTQKGSPLALGLMSVGGTAGGGRYVHERVRAEGNDAFIESSGKATVTTTEMMTSDGGSTQQVLLQVTGKGRFDLASGALAYRQLVVQGQLTGQSLDSQFPYYFAQTSWVALPLGGRTYASLDPASPIDLNPQPEEPRPEPPASPARDQPTAAPSPSAETTAPAATAPAATTPAPATPATALPPSSPGTEAAPATSP